MIVVFRFVYNLAGWLPCWIRASHSALRVFCRKNVLLCFMYFGVYVGALNLVSSIPDPSILTFTSNRRQR